MRRATEVVILEGPPELAKAVNGVSHASEDLAAMMRQLVAAARLRHLGAGRGAQEVLYAAVKGFRAEAGAALDDG